MEQPIIYKKDIIPCPLCASREQEEFYKGIDKYFSRQEVRFSVCRKCSLVFLDPKPTKEEYEKMYRLIFQDKRRGLETYDQAVDRLIKKKRYEAKLKELKYFEGNIVSTGKCLEIGGGWGSLAKAISDKYGCSIKIIEPSELASRVAREYYGLDVHSGDFDSYIAEKENGAKYDLIYSYHVFEHIIEPNDFLAKLKSIMKDDGLALLAAPNLYKPDCSSEYFFHVEHCFYYTPNTITLMLNKHGLEIVKFWDSKKDMKVLFRKSKKAGKTVYDNNEIKAIRRRLTAVDKRYKFLRKCKKILYYIFSEEQKEKINNFIYKILKRHQ